MDIEFLKSIPEDQMELMMMMQFEKHPEFYVADHFGHVNTSTEFADDGSSSSSSNPNANIPYFHMEDGHFSPINALSTTNSVTASPQTTPGGEMQFFSTLRPRNAGNNELHPRMVEQRRNMVEMRETLFKIAAMQPVHIDPESIKPPKRRNVKISKDPQSVAARHRREKISERIRILQRLVPGGTKMDTASMLDEAIHYMKFLKNQVQSLEEAAVNHPTVVAGMSFPVPMSSGSYTPMGTSAMGYLQSTQNIQHYLDA